MSAAPTPRAPMPGGQPALSRRLREATRAEHERVETLAEFNRLVVVRLPEAGADLPTARRSELEQAREEYREVYRRFLLAAYGFEAAVEQAFHDSPARHEAQSRGYALESVPATQRIRDDVAAAFGPGAPAALRAMPALAPVRTLAGFTGVEYVRRGSRAGGAVIGAVVRQNLALTPGHGASFLLHQGRGTRAAIQAFRDWADALAWNEDEAGTAIAGAIATFRAVGAWHEALEASLRAGAR